MARTQAETIAALREKVRELKAENTELINENESLSETIQTIYDAAAETFPDEETIEGEVDEDFDPDLDD